MDLRVIVLTSDAGLANLLRAQVENLGCSANTARSYDEAHAVLDWADAAVVDLAGDGIEDLRRLRAAAPRLQTLAVAVDTDQADQAREAGATHVLVEPFAIPDLVERVRSLQRSSDGTVIDLRAASAAEADDAPWWATR
jgi:DNA-binding response OmpR family regulator